MAEIDGKVLDAVEAALRDKPEATVDELFEIAVKVNGAVAELNKRQFHARYPLQIKRKLSPPRPRRSRGPRRPTRKTRQAPPDLSVREAVRSTFLAFATELAAAEARKDLVRVVAAIDGYVDDVLKATGRN